MHQIFNNLDVLGFILSFCDPFITSQVCRSFRNANQRLKQFRNQKVKQIRKKLFHLNDKEKLAAFEQIASLGHSLRASEYIKLLNICNSLKYSVSNIFEIYNANSCFYSLPRMSKRNYKLYSLIFEGVSQRQKLLMLLNLSKKLKNKFDARVFYFLEYELSMIDFPINDYVFQLVKYVEYLESKIHNIKTKRLLFYAQDAEMDKTLIYFQKKLSKR